MIFNKKPKLIKKYDKLASAYHELNNYLNLFDSKISKDKRNKLLKEIDKVKLTLNEMKQIIKEKYGNVI